jgi:uncharacterized membrane protein YdjX (TVP38/TMEM64 family)
MIFKTLFVLLVIGGIMTGAYFAFEHWGLGDSDAMAARLSSSEGLWIYAIFIVVMIVMAVFLNVVPGNVAMIVVAGYILFQENFWITLGVCSIGIVLTAIVLYCLGRFGGRGLLFWLFGKEKLEQRLDWVGNRGTRIMPWLFLIPFFPNDLVCITCGAARMKFWYFLLVVLVFRPVEIASILLYMEIIPMIIDQATVFEMILLVNVIIIDIALLYIYHKSLLKYFKEKVVDTTALIFKGNKSTNKGCACPPENAECVAPTATIEATTTETITAEVPAQPKAARTSKKVKSI